MEGSCTDDGTISDATLPSPPVAAKSPGLCRMGSGGSVVLDPADAEQQAESKKLPSSKYKGVVPQPNGRWGAQIYEKHQRVWLGTFNEEAEAARVYDVAAQRFRGRDAVTNFKPLSDQNDAVDLAFLASHSKAEIVDMLRKHTYSDELHQSKRHFKLNPNAAGGIFRARSGQCSGPGPAREQLFEKVVTPSDVGKLNRLVIPKQHAEKHFPLAPGSATAAAAATTKGLLLNFEDVNEKVWRFRYSYWNSSQSYVLTKGWSRFVKEKGLKAGDVVSFERSAGPDKQLFIDFKPKASPACAAQIVVMDRVGPDAGPSKIRLFGVDISGAAAEAVVSCLGNGKRVRENDDVPDLMLSLELMSSNKKRMVVGALS